MARSGRDLAIVFAFCDGDLNRRVVRILGVRVDNVRPSGAFALRKHITVLLLLLQLRTTALGWRS